MGWLFGITPIRLRHKWQDRLTLIAGWIIAATFSILFIKLVGLSPYRNWALAVIVYVFPFQPFFNSFFYYHEE